MLDRPRLQGVSGLTALEAGEPRGEDSPRNGVDASGLPRRESIGSPNRAESLADLDSSTRRRRTMALQGTTLGQRVASYPDLVRVVLIVAVVIVLMVVMTEIFGLLQAGARRPGTGVLVRSAQHSGDAFSSWPPTSFCAGPSLPATAPLSPTLG